MTLLSSLAWQAVYSNKALFHWFNVPAYLSNVFFRPMLQVILFALVGRYAGQQDAVQLFLTGVIAYQIPALLVATLSQMLYNELNFGTLTVLYASASNRVAAYLTRAGLQFPNGLLAAFTSLVTGWLVVGLDLSRTDWPALLLTLLALTASSCTFSLFVGTLCLHTRTWAFVYLIFQGLVLVLTGVIIPLSYLAEPLRLLAQVLPVTHALEAVRASVAGAPISSISGLLVSELIVCAAYGVLGFLSFTLHERRGKFNGTLERAAV